MAIDPAMAECTEGRMAGLRQRVPALADPNTLAEGAWRGPRPPLRRPEKQTLGYKAEPPVISPLSAPV